MSERADGHQDAAMEIGRAKYHTPETTAATPLVRSCAARARELWDSDGKEYLDFFAGHRGDRARPLPSRGGRRHPRAAATLLHVSNIYHNGARRSQLAKLLIEHSFADRVFFCNSGAEANEAAIKLARKCGQASGWRPTATRSSPPTTRSTAARSPPSPPPARRSTSTASSRCLPGFRHVPYDDLRAMRARDATPRPSRSWSSRSRARAASTSPTPATCAGAARALRRRGAAAGLRRGADRHGPHRQAVRPTSTPASSPTS